MNLNESEEKKMRGGYCPDCGNSIFMHGPCGGMAENIRCFECGSEFNWCPPLSTERINRNEPGFYHGAFNMRDTLKRIGMLASPKEMVESWWKKMWKKLI